MTKYEAARLLGLSPKTITNQVLAGRIVGSMVKIGRHWSWDFSSAEVARYERENRGRPGPKSPKRRSIVDRFWEKVDQSGSCWLWTASTDGHGYGVIGVEGGRVAKAHRVSYEIANGSVPDGMWILHSCDNPPCVRPSHLRAGTREDNVQDAKERDRYESGDRHHGRRKTVLAQRGASPSPVP